MSECSALATKQELESLRKQFIYLDQEVEGKIDQEEKPVIVQAGINGGASLATALFIPQVRQALAKAASVAAQVTNLSVKLTNAINILSSLASVTMVTILQFRVARLEGRTKVLEIWVDVLQSENQELRKGLDQNNQKLNRTIETSNLAIAKANTAVANADTAVNGT